MPEPKSVLLREEGVEKVKLSDIELQYHGAILARLTEAKLIRDGAHPEFNNRTFIENFQENERLANTFIEKKVMDDNIVIASGTVEQKLYTVAAEINRLNLSADVRVFDTENNEYQKLGIALTDTIFKTEEYEEDEENKLLRQVELLKQGHVFIQDNWICEYAPEKKINKDFVGKVSGVEWTEKLKKVFDGPKRSILHGLGVYLGNIREFDIKKQPFIFTLKISSYQEVKSRYGGKDKDGDFVWERWPNVQKKLAQLVDGATNLTTYDVQNGFTLSGVADGMVEEIHYQDEKNNEYQIYLNGTPMLPVGFPLSAVTPGGKFNITKQVLQAVNPFFVYGRSFVAKTREQADLLDEILRLLILKTRKSIHPPYANISGKVIPKKSLMPGVISMGIDPGALVKIGEEGQGVTASEYQMLNTLQDNIDKVTVSPQIQGQQGKSGTTAYEVSLLQKQAQKVLSLIVFASALLEKKVSRLRLDLILWKYYDPIDTRVDDARKELKNVYRKTVRKSTIEGRGSGTRMIVPFDGDEMPDSDEIADQEDYYDVPEPMDGMRKRSRDELGKEPVEIIYLSIPALRSADLIFYIEIDAREKDTSSNAKIMFREELRDIQALMAMGAQPNIEEIENTFALVWKRRKEKMFKTTNPEMAAGMMPKGAANVLNVSSPGTSTLQE